MKLNELSQAKDQDLIASVAAMKRAAAMARQTAIQTGTAIVVCEDQKKLLGVQRLNFRPLQVEVLPFRWQVVSSTLRHR